MEAAPHYNQDVFDYVEDVVKDSNNGRLTIIVKITRIEYVTQIIHFVDVKRTFENKNC